MSIHVAVFRGQGVFVKGKGYGSIFNYTSPGIVRVRFRNRFEEVPVADLLPVAALESVAHRFEERDIELELPTRVENRDAEIEADISDDEESEVNLETEVEFEEEFEETGD